MLNYVHQLIKITRPVFHTPYENKASDPQFLFDFWNK